MKKFWGKRTVEDILKRAKDKEFSVDTKDYDNHRDFIFLIKKYNGEVLNIAYNTFNGQFLGTYGDIEFSSNDATHDNENRMMMIFDLFYLPLSEKQQLPKYMD